jgi:hypothetical protein
MIGWFQKKDADDLLTLAKEVSKINLLFLSGGVTWFYFLLFLHLFFLALIFHAYPLHQVFVHT